ncbi:MAG: 50S ribosomal protein L24 [Hadesarchaea archaeon]|nr:50S ribosomal protein L24 [Hadesarchaea archaeon]
MKSKEKNESLHKRNKGLSARLSLDLKEELGVRSLPVRAGDKVRVERGDFQEVEGEVLEVDTKNKKIRIEGVEITKTDESEIPLPIHPSNVTIISIEKDKARGKAVSGRSEEDVEERSEETSEEA